MLVALGLTVIVLASFICNIALAYKNARCRQLADTLSRRLSLRDERQRRRNEDITSDLVLLDAYGDTPIGQSSVMQAWLLQPQRTLLKSTNDDVWVTVKRDRNEFVITGKVYHHRITAWGPTYNRASTTFLKVAYPEFVDAQELPC